MLTINLYTGEWQSKRSAPRINSHVRISESSDAREYDDFKRTLQKVDLTLEFVRWMPKLRIDVYKVIKAPRF